MSQMQMSFGILQRKNSRSALHVEDIGSEDENEDAIENSSQRKAIRNPDLQFEILKEVVDVCEDDYLNQFFNEFADLINTNEDVNLMQPASQDQNTPPEVEESTQNVKPFETIPYIPSKEGSDVEFIPDPILSDEDYKDIPEEFKPEERPKGMKYTRLKCRMLTTLKAQLRVLGGILVWNTGAYGMLVMVWTWVYAGMALYCVPVLAHILITWSLNVKCTMTAEVNIPHIYSVGKFHTYIPASGLA